MLTVKQIADRAGVTKPTVTRYLSIFETEHGKEEIEKHISRDDHNTMFISDELAERIYNAIIEQQEYRKKLQSPAKDRKAETTIDHQTPQNELQNTTTDHKAEPQNTTIDGKNDFAVFGGKESKTPQNEPQSSTTDNKETPQNTTTDHQTPHNTDQAATIATLNELINTLKHQINQLEQDKEHLKSQLEVKDGQIEQLNILLSQQQALHLKFLEVAPDPEKEGQPADQAKKKGIFSFLRKK